jgi:2-polyprenyl-6-methoxyphenol hydroxylase-like FAD-dependent oxidoreductase
MSALIYLVALGSVGWLVLWTIRDPKAPKWDWWPIDWWPFDTRAEADAQMQGDQQRAELTGRQRAVPWRERRSNSWRTQRVVGRRTGR